MELRIFMIKYRRTVYKKVYNNLLSVRKKVSIICLYVFYDVMTTFVISNSHKTRNTEMYKLSRTLSFIDD